MFASRFVQLILLLIMLGLSACATKPPAPVEERTQDATPQTTDPSQSSESTAKPTRTNANTYIVQQEENLYRIGIKTGIDYKEIAKANKIDPPYPVHVGQVLILPKPAQTIDSDDEGVQISTIEEDESGITSRSTSSENPLIPHINTPKRYREPYSDSEYARETEVIVVEQSANPDSQIAGTTETTTVKPVVVTKPSIKLPQPIRSVTWAWPHQGKIIRKFGDSRHANEGKNNGLDIAGKVGQPIKAAASGKVIYSGSDLRGYGKLVIIKHNKLYLSVYAHNSHLFVKEGQSVKKGQKIAELGSTEADRPKLHFEIRREGQSIDPKRFLPKK